VLSRVVRPVAVLVVVAQVVLSVITLFAPPDLYDQGIYLSTARFVADGFLPYRDFEYPYGPGLSYLDATLVWAHLDSMVAHRVLWALGRLAITLLLLRLAARRGLLPVGVAVAALLLLAPVPPVYVVPLLLVLLAVGVLERGCAPGARVFVLLAVAVWFRWEYLAVLGLAAGLFFLFGAGRRLRIVGWTAAATVLALAPYALFAALGGLDGMRQAVEYSLDTFPRFRSRPYPWDAPVQMARDVLNGRGGALVVDSVLLVAYLLVPLAVAVAAVVRFRRSGVAGFAQPALLLALALGVVSLYSLRVRADAFHAAPLLVGLGACLLLLLVEELRGVRTAAAVVTAAAVLLLVPNASRVWDAQTGEMPGLEAVVEHARGLVEPGDPLFVANRDNSVAYINAPYVYWALAAEPATPVVQYEPGHADRAEVQEEVVADLCEVRPVVVAWDAPVGPELDGVGDSDVLDDFLAESYREVFAEGEFSVLVPAGTSSC
jgi:hypothetical protein